MSDKPEPLADHEIAEAALRAFDESELMQKDHVASGIINEQISRNFSMQAAISVVDQLRKEGSAVIFVHEDDPRWKKP